MRRALRMQYEAGVRGLATLMLPAQRCDHGAQPRGSYGDAGHWLATGGPHLCLCILLHAQEGGLGRKCARCAGAHRAPSCAAFQTRQGCGCPLQGFRLPIDGV